MVRSWVIPLCCAALLGGCGGNLDASCREWVDEVNSQPCMKGDLSLDPEEYCAESTLDSYKANDCKESAIGYYECFVPTCDENDFPDWPDDCPAVCNPSAV